MIKRKVNAFLQRENSDSADFRWSSQSYTLGEILQKIKLPCVATCGADECGVEWKDFKFELTQPLLLHSTRKVKKVFVRCLQKEDTTGDFRELEHSLVVPADYEGWFHVIRSPDDRVKPDQTVSEVVNSGADQFLVGRSVSGIDLILDSEDGDGEVEINKRRVEHGGILKVTRLYDTELNTVDKNVQKTKSAPDKEQNPKNEEDNQCDDTLHENAGSKEETPADESPNIKYVMCSDEHEEDIVFPSSKAGFFYRIFDHEELGQGLMSAEDLIDKQEDFPLLVRHVIGEMPMLSFTYSSVMKCYKVVEEQTILASTLDSITMAPLELQVDSDVKFKISLNDAKIKYSDTYTEALQLCKCDGEEYLRGIKVAFKFCPKLSEETEKKEDSPKLPPSFNGEYERKVASKYQPTSPQKWEENKVKEKEEDDGTSSNASTLVARPNDTASETNTNLSDDEPSCYGSDMEEEDAQSEFEIEWSPPTVKRNPSKELKEGDRRVQILQTRPVQSPLMAPKVYNSSINSLRGSVETKMNSWNETPDIV